MDYKYRLRLDRIADCPDSDFPEILLQPRFNKFDDMRYHMMDLSDASNSAVAVDPRFTTAKITAIRSTAKNMAKYLDWINLWDDYMNYLETKYGSVEIAREMNEMGLLEDPWPGTDRRPRIRVPSLRKALEAGYVPSFFPNFIKDANDKNWWIGRLHEVCEQSKPDTEGLPEPDPNYRRPMSKEDIEYNQKMNEKLRRLERVNALSKNAYPSSMVRGWEPGVEGIDFIGRFYADVEAGAFDDPAFTDYTSGGIIETEMRLKMEAETMTEAQKLAAQRRAEKRIGETQWKDGRVVVSTEQSQDEMEFLVHLQKEFEIDVFKAMQGSGMSKKGIKAIRTQMEDAGFEVGMTKKQIKKARKMQKKADRETKKIASGSESLSRLLRTNQLFMNGGGAGPIEFEAGFRRLQDYDDD